MSSLGNHTKKRKTSLDNIGNNTNKKCKSLKEGEITIQDQRKITSKLEGLPLLPNNRSIASKSVEQIQLLLSSKQGFHVTKSTKESEICKKLAGYLTELLIKYIPDAEFTTIQVIKMKDGGKMSMHIDKKNVGLSYALSCGEYEGGNLWTFDDGEINTHNKIVTFDATKPHQPLPFRGERYSIIWYTMYSTKDTWNQGAKQMLNNITKNYFPKGTIVPVPAKMKKKTPEEKYPNYYKLYKLCDITATKVDAIMVKHSEDIRCNKT